MDASFDTDPGHQAVARLFDLARAGAIDDIEFNQLDSLVYSRLLQTYEAGSDAGSNP